MKRDLPPRPRLLVEELERRILYSADAAALLGLDGALPAAELRVHQPVAAPPAAEQATDAGQQAPAREIVFIDSRVPDAAQLADALMQQRGSEREFDIVVLDAGEDGVAQIGRILAGEHELAAIHVISHGADGAIEIGSTRLDAARLAIDADAVARWGAALAADGDLLLYGCDVAKDAAGQGFVQTLARLTGADVAASANLTGSADLGGDWTLEFATGAIHTRFMPSAFERLNWDGVLATFTVTSTADTTASGTLRWAITQANANGAGLDIIDFAITGGGLKTINVGSSALGALPTITGAVTIDGYTQAGASANTLAVGNNAVLRIELNGASAGSVNGLNLGAGSGGSTIRGLVINSFTLNGILVGSAGNTIAGNFIGTNSSGTADAGNLQDGIRISATGTTVGGAAPADRNLISGNDDEAIDIDAGFTGTVIKGNYIGTNAAGTAAIGNGLVGDANSGGVLIEANNTTVGGSNAGEGNLISGNLHDGIKLYSSGNTVRGNLIGTDAGGHGRPGQPGLRHQGERLSGRRRRRVEQRHRRHRRRRGQHDRLQRRRRRRAAVGRRKRQLDPGQPDPLQRRPGHRPAQQRRQLQRRSKTAMRAPTTC